MIQQLEYDYKEDLDIISSMVERLESYLQTDEVYGNQGMFVEGLPAITLGGLLMRIRRLNAVRDLIGKSGQRELDEAIATHDALYNEWRAHYEKKVLAELESRLTRIEQFIEETKDNPPPSSLFFEPEQMRRTIVQELLYLIQRSGINADTYKEKLNKIDAELKELVKASDFKWATGLETIYAPDDFWWLYSELDSQALGNVDD